MELFFIKYKFILDYLLPFIFGIGGVKLFDYFFNKRKVDVETEKSAFELYTELLNKYTELLNILKENNTNILQLERRVKELELLIIEKDKRTEEIVIEKDKKIKELLTKLNNQ